MTKFKIELVGLEDCKLLVDNIEKSGKSAVLTDGNNYCVSAKSLLGALASLEWDELYIQSKDDIYYEVKQWIK